MPLCLPGEPSRVITLYYQIEDVSFTAISQCEVQLKKARRIADGCCDKPRVLRVARLVRRHRCPGDGIFATHDSSVQSLPLRYGGERDTEQCQDDPGAHE